MKNYMILLFVLQLVFILEVKAGLGNYICYGFCMAPTILYNLATNDLNLLLGINNINMANMAEIVNIRNIAHLEICNKLCFNGQQTITNTE